MAFDVGRRHGLKFIAPLFSDITLKRILRLSEKYGTLLIFLSAIAHFPPYVPLLFGAFKISWRKFLLYGLLLRVLTFVLGGYLFQLGIIHYNI